MGHLTVVVEHSTLVVEHLTLVVEHLTLVVVLFPQTSWWSVLYI